MSHRKLSSKLNATLELVNEEEEAYPNYAATLRKLREADDQIETLKNKFKILQAKTKEDQFIQPSRKQARNKQAHDEIEQTRRAYESLKKTQERQIEQIRERGVKTRKENMQTIKARRQQLLLERAQSKQEIKRRSLENVDRINKFRRKLLEDKQDRRRQIIDDQNRKRDAISFYMDSRVKQLRASKVQQTKQLLSKLEDRQAQIYQLVHKHSQLSTQIKGEKDPESTKSTSQLRGSVHRVRDSHSRHRLYPQKSMGFFVLT